MSTVVRAARIAIFLVSAAMLGSASASAQDAQQAAEPVNITTADGVKLKGMFYPSTAKDAPTVIMLHPINDKNGIKSPEWKTLAESLQKAKYSVIMFDFRGHGDSTAIDDPKIFWPKPQNNVNVKTKNKQVIEVKDYIKQGGAYLPVLVNDIAAVRAYLERRNDTSKDCNTSNLIVVGADSGATLGALWINSEWHRFKFTPHPMFPQNVKLGMVSDRAEGNDIIGAVFLSVSPSLEKRTVKVEGLLKIACKDNGMAATFFCGTGDKASHNFAKNLEAKLKVKNSNKHEFIGAVELNTELTGMKLLQKGLKTDEFIVKYLDGVVADRKVQREDRDFGNTYYVWRYPPGLLLARNKKGDKTLNFDDYMKFITP